MVSIMPIACDLSIGYENCWTSGRPRYAQPLIRTNPDTPLGDMKRLFGDGLGSLTAVDENDLYKKISARQGLHGAIIEFAMDHPTTFSFIVADPNTRFVSPITFAKGTPLNGTPFQIEVIANNKIKLFRQSDMAPLYNNNSTIMCSGPSITGGPGSDHFYLAGNSNGADFIDLDQVSFYDFLRKFWTLTSVSNGKVLCGPIANLWVTNSTCKVPVARATMLFLQHSPFLERLRIAMQDPLFKARCCMGLNPAEDQGLCDVIGHTRQNQTCDVYMPEFCNTHPDDPYCGCYDNNVQKEYDALPKELKTPTYTPILRANPRCWVKGCTTGYIPPNYRDMGNCKITICDVTQNVVGDNYIKNISGQIMCEGGVPMQTPGSSGPSTGGPSTGGPSTGGPSTGGPSTGGPSTTEEDSSAGIPWAYVLLFLLIIFVIVLGTLVALRKKKDSPTVEIKTVT